MASDWKFGVYSSPCLCFVTQNVFIQGKEPSEDALWSFCRNWILEVISRWPFWIWYSGCAEVISTSTTDVVILEVGLAVDWDDEYRWCRYCCYQGIALDHTDWLGADREHIITRAGIFRANHYAVGELDMPHSIAGTLPMKNRLAFPSWADWTFVDWWSLVLALCWLWIWYAADP